MANKKAYDEVSVIRSLNKKGIVVGTHVIEVPKNANASGNTADAIGNGTWGKLDYMRKVHGYSIVFVDKTIKAGNNADTTKVNTKVAKREKKLNMATMAKAAMKKVKSK